MSSLGALGGDSDSLRKWRAIATWYKQADLVKALEGIVKDERAQWMARTGAVKAMSQLKTSKAELETLEKACDKCNSHVQKALKEAVATAK